MGLGVENVIALYKFRSYKLDQPPNVGGEKEFTFLADPHHDSAPSAQLCSDTVLVFANTLSSAAPTVKHRCRIMSITHPELGSIRSISTEALDYTLILDDGHTVVVNAEENPGHIQDSARQIDDWAFFVNLRPIDPAG